MTKRHIRRKENEMDKYENTFFSSVSGSFMGCIGAYGLLNYEKFAEKYSLLLSLFGLFIALIAIGFLTSLITKHKFANRNSKCHK